MRKIHYFFMGIAVLLLIGQTPQYLYRDLDLTWDYGVVSVWGEQNNNIHWFGGVAVNTSATCYYESGAVNDELYGNFSCPRINTGGDIVVDSVFLNAYTQGNEDNIWVYIQKVIDGVATSFDSVLFGVGVSGWDTAQVLQNGDDTVESKHGYRLFLDCTNNGLNDIRVEYFLKVVYHHQ